MLQSMPMHPWMDIEITPLGNLKAGIAFATRVRDGTLYAVQGAGQNPSRCRFPNAPRSRKDESLGDALALDCIPQRLGDTALSHHIIKFLGTPLPSNNLVGHKSRRTRRTHSTTTSVPNEVQCSLRLITKQAGRPNGREQHDTLSVRDLPGEMSEWLKEHAWKACVGETLPWVRIPLSPPITLRR